MCDVCAGCQADRVRRMRGVELGKEEEEEEEGQHTSADTVTSK